MKPIVLYAAITGPNLFDADTYYPIVERELALLRATTQVVKPLFATIHGDQLPAAALAAKVDLAIIDARPPSYIDQGWTHGSMSTWDHDEVERQQLWAAADALVCAQVPVIYSHPGGFWMRAIPTEAPFAPAVLPNCINIHHYGDTQLLEAIWRRAPDVAVSMDWRRRIVCYDDWHTGDWAPRRRAYEWSCPEQPFKELGWDAHEVASPWQLPDDPEIWADDASRLFWLEHHRGNPLWRGPWLSFNRFDVMPEEEHLRQMAGGSDERYAKLLRQFRTWAKTHEYEWDGEIARPGDRRVGAR